MNPESEIVSTLHPENLNDGYYRLLVESITDYAIFLLDTKGHIVTWNTGARKIKKYEKSEIVGKHFSIFYTEDAKAKKLPAQELKDAVRNGKFEEEGWRVRKDGSLFWANVIITPVYNADKDLIGFSKITRNLSERKKAEDDLFKAYEGLKESEERFRLLIDGVTDYAIFMLDAAGNVASWNQGAKRMKGYEASEIIGKFFSKFYNKEAVESGFPEYELQQARLVGRFEDEGWRYRKDGSVFWANTILTALRNTEGEIIGFSKITRDLTEKKRLEQQLYQTNEELKESVERSRLLINSVKDYAILMLSPEGVVMSWNTGAEYIKGYTAEEIIGKSFSTFYPREAIESGFPQYELKRAQLDGHFEDEGWRLRKDGSAFWANVIITPIYSAQNRLIGFTKITRDLTERRRNEELMLKNSELLKINNELDNFVYAASHDLKLPIINLEGLIIALEEDMGTEAEKHEQLLTMMHHAINSFKKVIADLGDIAKLQSQEVQQDKICVPELIAEIKESLHDLIKKSGAEIVFEEIGFDTILYSHKNLRSILYNLISNAIKYVDPAEKPVIRINAYISETKEYVLSVADNGLGISESQVGKIFSLFKRAHDHVEGSGIGLYLVKKILDNSGDKIKVTSKQGKGSTFEVYIKQNFYQA
ncbi:PAS domain-containing sensor histidine kinase [Pontibacter arcticus]|uniref:histidine kinase n=1 Tax=Pontibacter arcticus TaxID=2080288 RepID=A0A364REV2_9BACT|nr:PAS domain S-box protein [Pontibacter arcticus]RAU82802.1 PAS domain-containing sensor histidine kinase [Pontibacter arcticus]